MAYDTKALFSLVADTIMKSETLEEAYSSVMKAANVEGVSLPTYEEAKKELEEMRKRG